MCKAVYFGTLLYSRYNQRNMEYQFYTDPAFWGFYIPLLLAYVGVNWAINTGKVKLKPNLDTKLMVILGVLFGALIGFITYPGTLSDKLVAGAFGYGLLGFIIPEIIFEGIIARCVALKPETNISKLKIPKDYIDLLKENDINSLEGLIREDIHILSENTGLTSETIIKLRERARKFLKKN